jgi:acid stress-induced BolA-like protein IbaG/YrbA
MLPFGIIIGHGAVASKRIQAASVTVDSHPRARIPDFLIGDFQLLTPDQVQTYIEQGLDCDHVQVAGDGQHFEAIIVSAAFRGKSRVQQHQVVYKALGERMREEIHALSMKTFTPEDWSSRAT